MMNTIKVVMLGPSLTQQGGMATVENLILAGSSSSTEIQHISTHDEGSIFHRLLIFIKAVATFLRQLILGRVDLVHIHLAEKGSALRKAVLVLIAVLFRKPIVMHTHGCEFHIFHQQLPQPIKQVLNKILQRCDRFVVLSESWRDFYVSHCELSPTRVIVLPNPVELPPVVPTRATSEPDDKINFVFLGRIGQRKGAFDLLQAFAQLHPQQKAKATLTLAGDGEVAAALNLIQRLELESYVTLPGWLNTAQRNQLLAQAHVYVLPSYNEGLPMALLEAMSWGLPVITTPVGGIPEVVAQGISGLLVTPGDIEQLTQAMQTLIEHEPLRLSMGSAARQQVAPLDINHYYSSLFSIYASCIQLG
jgi:glycosyltransferase involved in cell wall biosynthesis